MGEPAAENGAETRSREGAPIRRGLRRWLLLVAGTLAVGLAALGAFLPLLPTTPFLLVAAACYLRSSERLYRWLFENRLFGDTLRRYHEGHGLPLSTRLTVLTMLWLSLGASAFGAVPDRLWWVRGLLLAIGLAVTVHVARQGPRRARPDGEILRRR